ncbi:MAG: secretin N-terminal domain-containing protein [Planctomycetota bacterium]
MRTPTKSRWSKLLMILALVMAACAIAAAENGNEAAGMEGSEDAGQKEVLTSLEQRMQKRIPKLEFSETNIDEVIRAIADQAGLNVIKSPRVTGVVTATLTDVPLGEALSNILAAHGFGYVVDKNIIRIAAADELTEEAERIISKIYRITYADVTEVAEALDKFKSQDGIVSFNKGTSNIIITDTESKVKAIDTFIEQIDRITSQILVEVRIYDITSRDKFDLGVAWDAGRNTTYTSGEPTAGKTNPFIVGGFEGPTAKTSATTIGLLRWGLLNESIDLDMQLRAEEEITDAKLLANPRIMVLDNETALFDIVTEHPYVERTITGNTVTETVKFKDVGVKLQVTPHLTRDGMLRLHIMPEFGVFVERVTIATSNVPVVDTRKVNTIALVKDGQTVVLGGMRKKDVSKVTNKVPLLGDLPLLGGLFRFEGEDTSITELVVFITPQIVKQHVMSETEKLALEATEFSGPSPDPTRAEKKAEESEE